MSRQIKCRGCNRHFGCGRPISAHLSQRPNCAARTLVSNSDDHTWRFDPNDIRNLIPNSTTQAPLASDGNTSATQFNNDTIMPAYDCDGNPGHLSLSPPAATVPLAPKQHIEFHPTAGKTYGRCKTRFETAWAISKGKNPYAPFRDKADWDTAAWVGNTSLSHSEILKYLKLPGVRSLYQQYSIMSRS